MRSTSLLVLLGLLGVCGSVLAEPGEGRPAASEKSTFSRESLDVTGPGVDLAAEEDDAPGVSGETVIYDVDPGATFKRVVMGPDGKIQEGGNAGSVSGGERLIYQNTLGINAINFPVNLPISDDVATTAPNNCNLTRYKFRVFGKVNPAGTGGDYQVTYGLYTNCPMATGTTNAQRDLVRIPGTEGVIPFVGDAPHEIEHIVPGGGVAIPTNVYLGIRFNRGNCGTQVGAPAMIGNSGDIWDHPNFPCNGYLGGFPGLPHASFWLEMYGSTNCADSFVGYKCQRPSGSQILLGANVQGVDDAGLIVPNCQMVGYEVVVKGVGLYTFDLRRECDSQVIPGTLQTFQVNANTQPQLQVARFSFNPPILLNDDTVFLSFKVDSSAAGVILAGIQPIIGNNDPDWFEIGLEGCSPRPRISGVHGAVNLAITCGGELPLGACCDPHLTECNDGPDLGKRCTDSSQCQAPGTCEAVCRQTTEFNCPFPPRGAALKPKWELGAECNIMCVGGTNAGNPCFTDLDCPGGGDCQSPFQEPCGQAACCRMRINPDQTQSEVCENMTKNECLAAPPLDKPRLWQLGWYCGNPLEQRCPRNACLARDGSCYVAHNPPSPGCNDPFCCTDVCTLHGVSGSHCCDVNWDNTCVGFANLPEHLGGCSRAAGNDQCAPDFPVARLEGALTIPYPGSAANDNRRATLGSEEPGFCCHNGTGVCVGGPRGGAPCIVPNDCEGFTCTERSADPGGPALNPIWFKFKLPLGTCQAGFPSANDPCATTADCRICVGGANADKPCTAAGDCPGGTCPAGGTCNNAVTTARIHTCNSNSPALDSVMQVFKAQDTTSPANECLSLTPVACSDDAANCSSTERNSSLCLTGGTPGGTYYVMVGAKTHNRLGEYRVTLATSCSAPSGTIANDYCAKATQVTDPTPENPLVIPFQTGRLCAGGAAANQPCDSSADCRVCVGGSNNGGPCTSVAQCPDGGACPTGGTCPGGQATYDCPSPFCASKLQNDVWWDYTATCTGEATFSTCGGTNPDTNLVVYDGCSKCPSVGAGDPLTPLGCNEDIVLGGCGLSSRVTAPVVQGQCYKVRVGDSDGFPVAGNLTITCTAIDPCPGLAEDAPTCLVDARRPHVPGTPPGAAEPGPTSVKFTFDEECIVSGAAPGDFTIACSPNAAPCPTLSTVNVVDQVVTVNFTGSFNSFNNWACVTHTATGAKVCTGRLPGDCNGNGATLPADIIALIDHLNNLPGAALPIQGCDMDRTGVCLPADIISLIDMLIGNGFSIWNGATLPACPAAP